MTTCRFPSRQIAWWCLRRFEQRDRGAPRKE